MQALAPPAENRIVTPPPAAGRPRLDPMTPEDWPAVRRIYEEGIATGQATFETEAPSWEAWDRSHLAACRWVARREEAPLGRAALSPVSQRCGFRRVGLRRGLGGLGRLGNAWRDVPLLERRSEVVGSEGEAGGGAGCP